MHIPRWVLGPVAALGLAACSTAANKQLDQFADRACACTTAECATQVEADLTKWIQDNQDARGDQDKAIKAIEKIGGCLTKTRGGKLGGKAPSADKAADKPADKAADKPAEPAADKPGAAPADPRPAEPKPADGK